MALQCGGRAMQPAAPFRQHYGVIAFTEESKQGMA